MKMKTIQISILAILFAFSVSAKNALLDKGNGHYTKQEYKEAIAAYEELVNTGKVSAELYFNLGNAYYKNNQITKAIINFERAKLLAPNDESIQFNLTLANQHVVDNIEALPQVFFIRWWNNLIKGKSADGWGTFSLVTFFLFLISLGAYFFSANLMLKRIGFWAGALMLVLCIFTFTFASKQKSLLTKHNFAIVTQPTVTVKSSPSDSGTNLFVIHEGLKIELVDKLGNWYEIRLADGNQGWLPSETMEKI